MSRTVSATSSGVLNIRWFRPIASTPSSSATSTIWSSASRLSCATVVLMLTRSGACLRRAASCSRRSPAAVRSNVPFTPRAPSCSSPGPSIDTLMCLRNPARQIRQRVGALFGDDRAVGRQVAAGVALLAEEIQDGHDVLPHEDLAAGEADLEARVVGERAAQRVERQLLAPLAFEVEQVADVAELAVQVAPHRRFVDDAHGGGRPARFPRKRWGTFVAQPGTRSRVPRQGTGPGRPQSTARRDVFSRIFRYVGGQHRAVRSPR